MSSGHLEIPGHGKASASTPSHHSHGNIAASTSSSTPHHAHGTSTPPHGPHHAHFAHLSDKKSGSSPIGTLPKTASSSSLQNVFKKNIVGDIFGSSTNGLAGLMYRSRVLDNNDTKHKEGEHLEVEVTNLESVIDSIEINESESDSDNDFKHFKCMNPKQQLAITMKNWTMSADNDMHIIKEGGVQALIALCYVEDFSIRKCCSSSFYHLSSRLQNREALLNAGATTGVVLCLHGSPPRCTWYDINL